MLNWYTNRRRALTKLVGEDEQGWREGWTEPNENEHIGQAVLINLKTWFSLLFRDFRGIDIIMKKFRKHEQVVAAFYYGSFFYFCKALILIVLLKEAPLLTRFGMK